MDRRSFVATTGIALGSVLGGCLSMSDGPAGTSGDDGTPTGNPSSTASPTDTPASPTPADTPTDPPTVDGVTVEDVVVRKAVAYESMMGSGGVLAGRDRQYVVATVRSTAEISRSQFTFETDERSWEPGLPDTAGALNRVVAGHEGGSVGRSLGGEKAFLAFAVPSPLAGSNPRIRFAGAGGAEWPLAASARERLAAPAPRFELEELTVPDEVSQGESLAVSLTVRNVSDTDGRFLAALYWPTNLVADDDESRVVEREVAAGDTATASPGIDTRFTTDEPETITLSVRGHVTADRSVQVRGASPPS